MFDKSFVEKILDRSHLALILVGVLLFIMGAAGGLPVGNPPLQVIDLGWRIALAVFGLLLFILGVLLLWRDIETDEKKKPIHTKGFNTMTEATHLLCEIAKSEKQKITIDIIASTGGSTISTLLPSIVSTTPAERVEISVFLIDNKSPISSYYPSHWSNEVEVILNKIRGEWSKSENSKVKVFNVYVYDFLPVLHGIMINKKHLLFGFFGWKHISGKIQLSGAETQHRYYSVEKQPDSQYLIDMFEDWVQNMPCTKVFSLTSESR